MLALTQLSRCRAREGAGGTLGGRTQTRFSGIVCGWRCTGDAGHGVSRSLDLLLPLSVDNWGVFLIVQPWNI